MPNTLIPYTKLFLAEKARIRVIPEGFRMTFKTGIAPNQIEHNYTCYGQELSSVLRFLEWKLDSPHNA